MLEPLEFILLTLSFFGWEKLRPEGAVTGLGYAAEPGWAGPEFRLPDPIYEGLHVGASGTDKEGQGSWTIQMRWVTTRKKTQQNGVHAPCSV